MFFGVLSCFLFVLLVFGFVFLLNILCLFILFILPFFFSSFFHFSLAFLSSFFSPRILNFSSLFLSTYAISLLVPLYRSLHLVFHLVLFPLSLSSPLLSLCTPFLFLLTLPFIPLALDLSLSLSHGSPLFLTPQIPVVKRALAMSERPLKLFASPWTAPPWMKTNNDYKGFGWLKEDMYQPWAQYFVR